MLRDPYTYVTLSLSPGNPANVGISFYSPELRAGASVLDSGRPYFAITSPSVDVTVSTTAAGPVTPRDVEIARQIVQAASHYLAGCERLIEQQQADSDQLALPGVDGSAA
ncbi:hypothetical protein [Microbispora siamensis]|uniref:Uncharacterized protein n=1 Tax=Microbispora siamensis TaxID=564413 RepID=A0ABQ4GTL8_9ACTN|nr:hypothetical protein [Microbispora siamensis]GIH64783.1 hypothetical protein Msi02_56000 [Microbispora siamensis]